MLLLYIAALFAHGAAEETCEVVQLLQTWHKPEVTVNGTEAGAVTGCANYGCGGGCWFGLRKYAKDYQCVYVHWLRKVEVFYCHDGKLLKCGSKPDATCSDFEAPNPCNPTTTSAGTTATTTATTRGLPTTTTTATTTDVMLWITKFHGVSQCLTWHNKKVIGAPCEAYQPAQLWARSSST